MPVVAKTDYVNSKVSVGTGAAVKLIENDGFRHNAVIVNTDTTNVLWIGGAAIQDSLAANGVPVYPGQSYFTNCLSELYGIAVGGTLDIRIMTEEEGKDFTTETMNGAV